MFMNVDNGHDYVWTLIKVMLVNNHDYVGELYMYMCIYVVAEFFLHDSY